MFSCISTEDILCDPDPDVSYKAYSNVEIFRDYCDFRRSAVMYLNDQLEHIFIAFNITALRPKKILHQFHIF